MIEQMPVAAVVAPQMGMPPPMMDGQMRMQADATGMGMDQAAMEPVHPLAATREQLEKWRDSCRYQQNWREEAAKAHEYFDGNQYDSSLLWVLQQRGIPLIVVNCIKRWINSVVGVLERNLTDWQVKIDAKGHQDLETALSQLVKTEERLTKADRACLNAGDSAFKGGIGWVEVGKEDDPFSPTTNAVTNIKWREMSWDMSAQKPDLSDAEWKRRLKAYRRKTIIEAFPHLKDAIMVNGGEQDQISWNIGEQYERDSCRDASMMVAMMNDPNEDFLAVSEFRYKVSIKGWVAETPMGVRPFDPENPAHMQAYQSGMVKVRAASYKRYRQAYWIGPLQLLDRWLDVPCNHDGWVAFICYVEDKTNTPYGLIRDMFSLQDEVNTRRAKAAWAMDSTTTLYETGAFVDPEQAREDLNRRDGMIEIKSGRMGAVKVDRHEGISKDNVAMYQEAEGKVGYVHGLDAPFVGQANTASQSGVAQQTLIQQSMTCLGKAMNNYTEARRQVGELLTEQTIAEMRNPRALAYKDAAGNNKELLINQPDPTTGQVISPMMVKRSVVLAETPSTPTYREQQFLKIVDTLRSMPPQAQLLLLPAMIEMSDLPGKEQLIKQAKQQLGMQTEPQNEQEAAAMQAEAEKKAAMEQLEMRGLAAKVAESEAKATQIAAAAADTQAKTQELLGAMMAKLETIVLQNKKIAVDTLAVEQDMADQAAAFAEGGPDKTEAIARW